MRGEYLLNIYFQNKIMNRLIEAGAFSKERSIELSNIRKGLNFKYLLKKNVVVESYGRYYLNQDIYEEFKVHKFKRGHFIK